MEREQKRNNFVENVCKLRGYNISPMKQDASTRSYYRIEVNGKTYVLMDEPSKWNRLYEFAELSKLLRGIDVYAPAVIEKDMEDGFLLLEDFGEGTFTKLLENGVSEEKLYKMATEVLLKVAGIKKRPSFVKKFEDEHIIKDICYFTDWYYPTVVGQPLAEDKRNSFIEIVKKLIWLGRKVPDKLVLWDYHVDNLMMVRDTSDCGVLDFQDAFWGPVTYDIMSLLEDARRAVSPQIQRKMRKYFADNLNGVAVEDFDTSFLFFSMFRHMRVLGRFSYLMCTRGKDAYLRHVPHLWDMLNETLKDKRFIEMKKWLDKNLPAEMRGIPKRKPITKAMILAAGRGTRMKDLVDDIPKPLIEVNGKAMIDYKFDLLSNMNIKDVVVNVSYQGDKIEKHLEEHSDNFDITISREAEPLETGGGVKKALSVLGDEPFFTLNSDEMWNDTSYKPVMWQMMDKWDDKKYDIILLINPMASTHEKGRNYGDYRINKKDRLERNVERKPGGGYDYFYTGITLVNPEMFKLKDVPKEEKFSMVKMFDLAEKRGRLGYVIIKDEIFHVGTPEDKAMAEKKFKAA